ncbi:MAG: hypothetical protein SFV18_15840 [Bryobacteraceae bacterium]|nr:hypothetical protein [Bryobacteraceae bacterium]
MATVGSIKKITDPARPLVWGNLVAKSKEALPRPGTVIEPRNSFRSPRSDPAIVNVAAAFVMFVMAIPVASPFLLSKGTKNARAKFRFSMGTVASKSGLPGTLCRKIENPEMSSLDRMSSDPVTTEGDCPNVSTSSSR